MSRARTWRRNRRAVRLPRWHVALAVLALLLQAIAPLAIAPPRGQPVHFAHSHHGEDGPANGHHAGGAPSDNGACPVCQALQAGGAGLAAPALVFAAVGEVVPAPSLPRADAPVAALPSDHRARAPPIRT
jgi:hypothetical protein